MTQVRTASCVLGALAVLLTAAPPPLGLPGMRAYGGPLEAWPFYLMAAAGVGALLAVIAYASLPLAVLVAWIATRTAHLGFPERCLEVLGWTVMAALVVAGARAWPAFERWAIAGLLTAAAVNALLGVLNVFGVYLFMWVQPAFQHRPTAFLRNPTYWGLYLALTLPLLQRALDGRWWRAFIVVPWVALIALSYSVAAIGATAVVLATRLWPRLDRRRRLALVGAILVLLAVAMILRPHGVLGGRAPYWRVTTSAWWATAPLEGVGPGLYRTWAYWEHGPIRQGVPGVLEAQIPRFIHADPHSEVIQLAFELGIVGLAIGLWLLVDTLLVAVRAWRSGDPDRRAWALVLGVATVALWWAGIFHQGALTVPVLLARAYVATKERPAR